LLYVNKELQAVKVEVIGDFREHIWCKIRVGSGYDLLIGVCYWTPTEQVFAKDIHSKLRDMLLVVSKRILFLWEISIMGILIGVLVHVRLVQWKSVDFLECLQEEFITQHVTGRTIERSILDLVLKKISRS